MSENQLPRFFNSHLQEAADKSLSSINSFRSNLDTISSDIKNLEKWLRETGVCLPFKIQFDQRYEFLDPDRHNEANDSYQGRGRQITEQLAWDRHEPSSHWRVIYIREVTTGEFLFEKGTLARVSSDRKEIEEYRPLIEMPGQIRLRAYERLPELLYTISAGIKPEDSKHRENQIWEVVRSAYSKQG